jgi:imidazoleglycerol-phosphate dehydratase
MARRGGRPKAVGGLSGSRAAASGGPPESAKPASPRHSKAVHPEWRTSAALSGRLRRAVVERKTHETQVRVRLDLDGHGRSAIETGIGFLDHMLTAFATHGRFDLDVTARGDLHVDAHHTVEDVGIVLGQALMQALGDKAGITRFGHAYVPLDEALSRCVIDLSGRPYLHYGVAFKARQLGTMPTELFEDFFWALADHGRLNLHLDTLRGRNAHHVAETLFKAAGRALSMAVGLDPRVRGVPSTKGSL